MGFTPDFFLYAVIFGLIYGILLQKADFCFVASVRDFISVRDSRVGKGVLILIAVVLLGWGTVLTLGLASINEVWTTPIGVSNLIGGILFGVGMTIAGSCASGTLYRSGMGYIHFWIVLASMIVGNILFSFIYNPWAEDYYFKPLLLTDQGFTLFQLNLPYLLLPILIVGLMVFISIRRFGAKNFFRGFKDALVDFKGNPFKKAHWDIRVVAALFGLTATVQFVVMSSISLTGPETRIGGVILSSIFGEDFVYNNVYLNQMFAGFPVVGLGPEETLIIFIIIGSFLSAILSGQFRIRKPKLSRLPSAIGGGLIMGVSSRMAPGCNIANVIGAGGLSVSSFIVIIGMAIGVFIVTAFVFKMPLLLFHKMDME